MAQHGNGGWRQRLRDLTVATLRRPYAFLDDCSTQSYLLNRLSAKQQKLFRLLCMNAVVTSAELQELLSGDAIARYVQAGVLRKAGNGLALCVSLVPYRDYYYISDARGENADPAAQADPVHLSQQTHAQVLHLRRRLQRRPVGSMLEMGTGTGIVLLELREWAGLRTGADTNERALGFARANQQLRSDTTVEFVRSNLFSAINRKYDLILFNPYQPSENNLPLIRRFLAEAPQFLTERGQVVLLIRCRQFTAEQTLLANVADVLAEHRLGGERDILMSWRSATDDGERTVAAWSALWLTRQSGAGRQPIRTKSTPQAMALLGKRLLTGF